MRLSVSNIAWDIEEDKEVVSLLHSQDINAIDVAPGKYFSEPALVSDKDIACVRAWWNVRGIEVIGMQALLFGTTGLNIFALGNAQESLLTHLTAICRIGAGLGATRLVFGSPKNRDRSGLDDSETMAIAIPFFRRLGDIAESYGVVICLEPNPTHYGANFMTTSAETAQVVERVAHPSIKMQLDTGAMNLNGENVSFELDRCAHLIGHVHASEPDLLPLGDGGTDHEKVHAALKQHLPTSIVTVEMVATKRESHLVSLERALIKANDCYRPSNGVNR